MLQSPPSIPSLTPATSPVPADPFAAAGAASGGAPLAAAAESPQAGPDWSKWILPGALGVGGLMTLAHHHMSRPDEEDERRRKMGGVKEAGPWGAALAKAFSGPAAKSVGRGVGKGLKIGVPAVGALGLIARGAIGGQQAGQNARGMHLDKQRAAAEARPEFDRMHGPRVTDPAEAAGPLVGGAPLAGAAHEPGWMEQAGQGLHSLWGSIKPYLGPLGQPIEDAGSWAKEKPWQAAGLAGAAGLGLYGLSSLMGGDDEEDEEERRRGKYGSGVGVVDLRVSLSRGDKEKQGQVAPGHDPHDPVSSWPTRFPRDADDHPDTWVPPIGGVRALTRLMALAGGGLGAGMAPSGHRMEGAARGITSGLGTGVGSGLGALGGAALGGQIPGDYSGTGALAGLGVGGIGGHVLANWLMGDPGWKGDKRGAAARTAFFPPAPGA